MTPSRKISIVAALAATAMAALPVAPASAAPQRANQNNCQGFIQSNYYAGPGYGREQSAVARQQRADDRARERASCGDSGQQRTK